MIHDQEEQRLASLMILEQELAHSGHALVAGVDEAGRGPLAGPVVAAACVMETPCWIPGVDDSKKLSPKKREKLFDLMMNDSRLHFGLGLVQPDHIDEINILQATLQAMKHAVAQLKVHPSFLLVDGTGLSHEEIPSRGVIKGDQKSLSIAMASIVAKVTRDRLMQELHLEWPHYGFDRHKGYGTRAHLEALKRFGPCPQHRFSFEPVKSCGVLRMHLTSVP